MEKTKDIQPELREFIQPFLTIWDALPIGISITDPHGDIVFYNQAQSRIDNISVKHAMGQNVHILYGPDPGPSLVSTCIDAQKSIINYVCVYRTNKGKIINSGCWVFPLIRKGILLGAICYVKELDKLTEPQAVSKLTDLPIGNGETGQRPHLTSKNLTMLEAIETARHAAGTPSPILLYGGTGTGKDLFARNIHNTSMLRNNPFITLNCAAIPETLLESLLFGTTRGAFTGALDKPGLFEQANGGTLFLDETDSMPLSLQPKLLRVLQDKKIRRMGSEKEIQLSLKIISAMSKDPLESVRSGKLRSDLFYRLGVVVIGIPPLKDRLEDLEDLCTYFLLKHNTLLGKKIRNVSPALLKMFYNYEWPGNVRELEHLIEACMNVTHDKESLGPEMVPGYFLKSLKSGSEKTFLPEIEPVPAIPTTQEFPGVQVEKKIERSLPTLEQMAAPMKQDEKTIIARALSTTFGNITQAADILGVSRQSLSYKMKKYGLSRNDFRTYS